MVNLISENKIENPLSVDEVMRFIRNRWGVTYELKILVKGSSLYLQMMWGFLEKQSLHLTEQEYRENLSRVLEIINRLGKSSEVRDWLFHVQGKPKLGRALSLHLKGDWRLEEFVL